MRLNPAQILHDRYQIQTQLSNKPGRQTYLAVDLLSQNLVVLKLVYFGETLAWDDFQFFEREAQVLPTISHPAIPQYLDSFDFEQPNYKGLALVQTYIEARSLAEHLQAGRTFTYEEIQQIAKDLLAVLIYLHSSYPPIIHRDIKPSNILLGDRSGNHPGQIHLIDFGSVRTSVHTDGSITIVGTYGYMPFEQFRGQATPVSDLYSLGMTLIQLATGIHPADLPQDDFQVEYASLSHLHPIFASWLQWLTQRNPKQRSQSAQIALQALEAIPSRSKANPADEWKWNGSHWIPQSPTRIRQKPKGSRVILTKSDDAIEIKIPAITSVAQWIGTIFALSFWGAWLIFLWLVLTQPMAILEYSLILIFFGVPLVGFILAASQPLINCFLSTRWRIDRRKMIQEYRLLGLRWKRSEPRDAIIKLTYKSTFYENTKEGSVKVAPKLVFHVGVHERVISNLTEVELEWLASELSDWLGIPINESLSKSVKPPIEEKSHKAFNLRELAMQPQSWGCCITIYSPSGIVNCVQIQSMPEGTAELVYTNSTQTSRTSDRVKRQLSSVEVSEFRKRLKRIKVSKFPFEPDYSSDDKDRWLFEVAENGQYYAVKRWEPHLLAKERGLLPLVAVAKWMFQAAKQ